MEFQVTAIHQNPDTLIEEYPESIPGRLPRLLAVQAALVPFLSTAFAHDPAIGSEFARPVLSYRAEGEEHVAVYDDAFARVARVYSHLPDLADPSRRFYRLDEKTERARLCRIVSTDPALVNAAALVFDGASDYRLPDPPDPTRWTALAWEKKELARRLGDVAELDAISRYARSFSPSQKIDDPDERRVYVARLCEGILDDLAKEAGAPMHDEVRGYFTREALRNAGLHA